MKKTYPDPASNMKPHEPLTSDDFSGSSEPNTRDYDAFDKLVILGAMCDICKYKDCCAAYVRERMCPSLTGDVDALQPPPGATDLEHYVTQVATEAIYGYLKKVRELVTLVHPEDPYLSMCILPKESDLPGRILFNNTYWELPEEKQINFHEVDPIPTNLQATIRDSRR